ncbi:hypothetical protein COCOBI_19-2380 [Coccomyxa sp. Obi]|nr:hypothetical protein COCOBI_19-2380 [Coccomyxa sp. Obi]
MKYNVFRAAGIQAGRAPAVDARMQARRRHLDQADKKALSGRTVPKSTAVADKPYRPAAAPPVVSPQREYQTEKETCAEVIADFTKARSCIGEAIADVLKTS